MTKPRIIYVVRIVTATDEDPPKIDHVGPFEFEEAALHYIRLHIDPETKHPFTGVMEIEIPEGTEGPSPEHFITNDKDVLTVKTENANA